MIVSKGSLHDDGALLKGGVVVRSLRSIYSLPPWGMICRKQKREKKKNESEDVVGDWW